MSSAERVGFERSDMKVAIVGTGVSGLVTAHLLHPRHDVTVFEADDRLGGHTNTVPVELDGTTVWVDTGFLVYNERNYPGFVRLLDELGIATEDSDMSFSVTDDRYGLEWRSTSLSTVFAQRRRLVDPRFIRMLADVVRFNRQARALLAPDATPDLSYTVEDLITEGSFSRWFREWYLVPMGAAIWSADPATFTRFPAVVFARFFHNHGLISLGNRPQWRTVTGGARHYVDAIAARLGDRVRVATPVAKIVRSDGRIEMSTVSGETETFDRVVLATHSDQALELLSDPSPAEREILGAIRYQPNVATLHTDSSLLPASTRAHASWNYHVQDQRRATLTYHLNTLQNLDIDRDVCVTLNRPDAPRPETVVRHIDYAHPVFDEGAIRAQGRRDEISGVDGTFYCGAYWGYGFHEDGVQSALAVARHFGVNT